jgi:hypothetical protein
MRFDSWLNYTLSWQKLSYFQPSVPRRTPEQYIKLGHIHFFKSLYISHSYQPSQFTRPYVTSAVNTSSLNNVRTSVPCYEIPFKLNCAFRENHVSIEILPRDIFVSVFIKESHGKFHKGECMYVNMYILKGLVVTCVRSVIQKYPSAFVPSSWVSGAFCLSLDPSFKHQPQRTNALRKSTDW